MVRTWAPLESDEIQAEAVERTARAGIMGAGVSLFGVDNELGMSGAVRAGAGAPPSRWAVDLPPHILLGTRAGAPPSHWGVDPPTHTNTPGLWQHTALRPAQLPAEHPAFLWGPVCPCPTSRRLSLPAGAGWAVKPSKVATEVLARHAHDHNRRHLVVTVLQAKGLTPRRGVVVALRWGGNRGGGGPALWVHCGCMVHQGLDPPRLQHSSAHCRDARDDAVSLVHCPVDMT